jgi:hypothetical protein
VNGVPGAAISGFAPAGDGNANRTIGHEMIKAWFACSACWVGFWSWYYHVLSCGSLHLGEAADMGWHCDGPVAEAGGYEMVPLVVVVAVIIGIPIAVLLTGVALRLLASQDQRPTTKK